MTETVFIDRKILTRALDKWATERMWWLLISPLLVGVGIAIGRFWS